MSPMQTRIGGDLLRTMAQECRCGIDECRENVEAHRQISGCAITAIPKNSIRTLSPPLETDE
jgi:hypothetical protein